MLSPTKQTKEIYGRVLWCRHGCTSTSHIKIKIFVQNHNKLWQRSKYFVISTPYRVSCASLIGP
ncbi:hypothetical protein EKN24_08060 [Enterobacter asburiae]|nr:hypothetical protein EKN24_08060 [Enterobacter asburiae]